MRLWPFLCMGNFLRYFNEALSCCAVCFVKDKVCSAKIPNFVDLATGLFISSFSSKTPGN